MIDFALRGGVAAEPRDVGGMPYYGRVRPERPEDRQFIGFDTETEPITDQEPTPRLVCLQWFDPLVENKPQIVGYRDACEAFVELARRAIERDAVLVAHNLAYDTRVLVKQHPQLWPLVWELYRLGLFEDTLLLDKLDDIARGSYVVRGNVKGRIRAVHGVEEFLTYNLHSSLRHRFQGKLDKADDTWRLRYGELREVPVERWPAEALEYALQDGVVVHALRVEQERGEAVDPAGGLDCYVYADAPAQTRADWMLQLARWKGIHTDPNHVPGLLETFQKRAEEAKQDLLAAKLLRPPRWMPVKKEWQPPTRDKTLLKTIVENAYARAGLELPLTKTGQTCCNQEALETIQSDEPILKSVLTYDRADKQKQFAVSLGLGFEHPIHTEPNALVENGRISWGSQDAEGNVDDVKKINLTNLPSAPGIRESFVPPGGAGGDYVFFSIDYAQLELCALGQVLKWTFGTSAMADMINEGIDLHSALGAQFLGIDYDAFRAEKDTTYKPQRNAAKRANFGFPGGMGIKRFQSTNRDLGLTKAQVKKLKDAWFRTYPEMARYFEITSRVADAGQLEQFTSGRLRSGLDFCNTSNSYFSGLAADGGKEGAFLAQMEMWSDPTSPAYGGWLVAFVHDEIVGCLPRKTAAAGVKRLYDIMMRAMQQHVPDVNIQGSIALMDRWRKNACACYDKDGNLVPYEYSSEFMKSVRKGKDWLGDIWKWRRDDCRIRDRVWLPSYR